MTRTFFLVACFVSALASCTSGMMQQGQQGQQGQMMDNQQMSSMQMAESQNKNGGEKNGNGGGNTVVINKPIIVIATNAGGNAQTQQMNNAVQPPAATHTVTVGGMVDGKPSLTYSPDSIQAAKYDMVQFNFMQKNHTVTQSTFDQPCKKMQPMPAAASMPAMPAPIDSEFKPFDGTGTPPMMMVQVLETTTPMWFYCRQKTPMPHCGSGNGMTFSINPNQPGQGAKTQAAFKMMAMMSMSNTTSSAGSAGASGVAVASGSAVAPAAMSTNVASSQNQDTTGSTGQTSQAQNSLSMTQGVGQSGTGGACECSCLCGANAFPNAMQGIGAMGGLPGAIPATGAGMKFRA